MGGRGYGPETGARSDAGAPRVVVFESSDIAATIGRPRLLEDRIGTPSIAREPGDRSDVVLQRLRGGTPPDDLDAPAMLVEQMSSRPLSSEADVVVMSLAPDLVGPVPWVHPASGWLVHVPPDAEEVWPSEVVAWVHTHLEPAPALGPAAILANQAEIAATLRDHGGTLFLFNVSTFDPTDQTHRFAGRDDTFEVAAQRVLAGLERMAGDLGIQVVDIDGAVAEIGAAGCVEAPGRLGGEAVEFVTEEAILAIDQSGALGGSLQAPVMRVRVPPFDRRTKHGVLAAWHTSPGARLEEGDPICEIRFAKGAHRFDRRGDADEAKRPDRRARGQRDRRPQVIVVMVVAGSEAWVHDLRVEAGEAVTAGDVVAVATRERLDEASLDEADGDLRVGARIVAHGTVEGGERGTR